MCHIMYYPEGVEVRPDDLLRAAEVSDEGFGWGIAGRAMLWNDHDLEEPAELIRQFAMLRHAMIGQPAVFHCRLATTGKVSRTECHPIIVKPDGMTELGVFLNGTLDIPLPDGKTDTRTFAEDLLPWIDLDDPVHRDETEIMVRRSGAKMAILRHRGRHDNEAIIFNRSQWIVTPYGALASQPEHLGKGVGWDERTDEHGDLWRWRMRQPGQCHGCDRYGCTEQHIMPAAVPPGYRNETKRRAERRA